MNAMGWFGAFVACIPLWFVVGRGVAWSVRRVRR